MSPVLCPSGIGTMRELRTTLFLERGQRWAPDKTGTKGVPAGASGMQIQYSTDPAEALTYWIGENMSTINLAIPSGN